MERTDIQKLKESTMPATVANTDLDDILREVGPDSTATFDNSASNPTEHASSENLRVAPKDDDEEDEDEDVDDDLEDDEDEDEDEDEDDLDEEDDEDEDVEDDDVEDDDEDEDDEEDEEDA